MNHVLQLLHNNEAFKLGEQSGVNRLAEALRGKVDATTLYQTHQQVTQEINLEDIARSI